MLLTFFHISPKWFFRTRFSKNLENPFFKNEFRSSSSNFWTIWINLLKQSTNFMQYTNLVLITQIFKEVWIRLRGLTSFKFVISIILKNLIILLKMDYDLVVKTHVNELKNYLKVCRLKISGNENKLVARVSSAMGNNFMPVKKI